MCKFVDLFLAERTRVLKKLWILSLTSQFLSSKTKKKTYIIGFLIGNAPVAKLSNFVPVFADLRQSFASRTRSLQSILFLEKYNWKIQAINGLKNWKIVKNSKFESDKILRIKFEKPYHIAKNRETRKRERESYRLSHNLPLQWLSGEFECHIRHIGKRSTDPLPFRENWKKIRIMLQIHMMNISYVQKLQSSRWELISPKVHDENREKCICVVARHRAGLDSYQILIDSNDNRVYELFGKRQEFVKEY